MNVKASITLVFRKYLKRVAAHINTELLSAYWNVGRIIVEHEQNSNERAGFIRLIKEK